MAAVLLVIYGLKRTAENGVDAVAAFGTLAGLVVAVVFVRRQRTLADPLVDLHLFRTTAFSTSLGTNLLAIGVSFGPFLFIAQYLQLVLGLSPLQAGLWTLPSATALIVGSMLPPLLLRWMRPAVAMGGGLALAALGAALLTRVEPGSSLGELVAGSVILFLGMAPVVTIATDLIVSAARPERAGSASSLSETSTELGGALGIALLGSVGTIVYRAEMADTVPDGLSQEAADVAATHSVALLPSPSRCRTPCRRRSWRPPDTRSPAASRWSLP